jgi:hypothetical protein
MGSAAEGRVVSARLLNIGPMQYHKSKDTKIPCLSNSVAKVLLDRSPLHAYHVHPLLGGASIEPTEATNNGSVIHSLILGKGDEKIVVLPYDAYLTKEAKAARDAALADGKIPIKAQDHAPLVTAAEQIRRRLLDLGIDLRASGFVAEQAIEWDEQGISGPVRCRAMFDLVNVDTGLIFDVKSISEATIDNSQRSVWRYSYHMQDAVYRSALTALTGEPSAFTFLFCELDAPYGVLPAKLSGALREIGEAKWRHAVRIWEECLTANRWPGYTAEIVRLEPPGWALAQMETALS